MYLEQLSFKGIAEAFTKRRKNIRGLELDFGGIKIASESMELFIKGLSTKSKLQIL